VCAIRMSLRNLNYDYAVEQYSHLIVNQFTVDMYMSRKPFFVFHIFQDSV